MNDDDIAAMRQQRNDAFRLDFYVMLCIVALVIGFATLASAQSVPADDSDSPTQVVWALDKDDAHTCDVESACILVTQKVAEEINKMHKASKDCITGKRI